MEPLIRARGVALAWQGSGLGVRGIDLDVAKGELVAIVGPNGAGKSTLLKLLAGIVAPDAGAAALDGREAHRLPRDEAARVAAFVPQASTLPFDYSALEVVLMGRHPFGRGLLLERPEDVAAAETALARALASPFRDRPYRELSGGERQRVVLARALCQGTPALLLDEPTSAQDLAHGLAIFALLAELAHRDGRAVALATHDLNGVARFADRIAVIADGRVVRQGPPREVVEAGLLRDVFHVEAVVGRGPEGAPYAVPVAPKAGAA